MADGVVQAACAVPCRNGSGATSSLFGHLYTIIEKAPPFEEGDVQICASNVSSPVSLCMHPGSLR